MKLPKPFRWPIDKCTPDPDNANEMSPEDFAQLKANIKKHGPLGAILLGPVKEDGTRDIVDGHHRWEGTEAAGFTEIYAFEWDGSDEMRDDFREALKEAASLSFNRLRGSLNHAKVGMKFQRMEDLGMSRDDMTMTGFSIEEVDDLLDIAAQATADADDVLEGASALERDRDEDPTERPLELVLTFTSTDDLKRAKRGLRRAAGKGVELGEGLLRLLSGDEE